MTKTNERKTASSPRAEAPGKRPVALTLKRFGDALRDEGVTLKNTKALKVLSRAAGHFNVHETQVLLAEGALEGETIDVVGALRAPDGTAMTLARDPAGPAGGLYAVPTAYAVEAGHFPSPFGGLVDARGLAATAARKTETSTPRKDGHALRLQEILRGACGPVTSAYEEGTGHPTFAAWKCLTDALDEADGSPTDEPFGRMLRDAVRELLQAWDESGDTRGAARRLLVVLRGGRTAASYAEERLRRACAPIVAVFEDEAGTLRSRCRHWSRLREALAAADVDPARGDDATAVREGVRILLAASERREGVEDAVAVLSAALRAERPEPEPEDEATEEAVEADDRGGSGISNGTRAERARQALSTFARVSGQDGEPVLSNVRDLVTNLVHLLRIDEGMSLEDINEELRKSAFMAEVEFNEDED